MVAGVGRDGTALVRTAVRTSEVIFRIVGIFAIRSTSGICVPIAIAAGIRVVCDRLLDVSEPREDLRQAAVR